MIPRLILILISFNLSLACLKSQDPVETTTPKEDVCVTCDPFDLVAIECPPGITQCELKPVDVSIKPVESDGPCLRTIPDCDGYDYIGMLFEGENWAAAEWDPTLFDLDTVYLICNDNMEWVLFVVGHEEASAKLEKFVCFNTDEEVIIG